VASIIIGPGHLVLTIHFYTRHSQQLLGLLYNDQGKLAEAEKMYRREMEKTLGADHTSTLSAVANLGILYAARGKPAEGRRWALLGYLV
jgi:Tetratricopeptide repeat